MGIPITQPFLFEGNLPNFDRDVINSALFASQDPLKLSVEEGITIANKYDVGHVVWDVATRHHYVVESKTVSGGVVVGNFQLLGPTAKTSQEWYDSNYTPKYGEVIVITDHKTVIDANGSSKNIPVFKIGDGKTSIAELSVVGDYSGFSVESGHAAKADVASRLEHTLTIGEQQFDGSADVEVEKYKGENDIS